MVYGHYYLAQEWVKSGHDVTIIASSFAHTRNNHPLLEKGKLVTEEFVDGIRYLWLRTPEYDTGKKIGRSLNILTYAFLARFLQLPLGKVDLVISSSHHTLSIFAARKIAKINTARLIFEVRDIWPLSLIEIGKVSERHPFIKLLQYAEDLSYKVADEVVSVLPFAMEHMCLHGMEAEKFNYIPNGIAADENNKTNNETLPELHLETLSNLREQGYFLVGYAGNIGEANELSTLIHSLNRCSNEKIAILIIGKGPLAGQLEELIVENSFQNRVYILPAVSKNLVQNFLKLIDLAFIGLKNEPLFRFGVSPTKLNDFFLARKPILYAINFSSEVVSESGAILQCEAGNPSSVARGLDELSLLSRAQLRAMGESGYNWAIKNRSYSVLAKKFLKNCYENVK